MAYIGKKPEDLIRGNSTYNSFTGDGSTTAFDVTNILPDGGQYDVEVFVDNVRQEAGASKSYTIGNDGSGDLKRITFNVAPDSDSEIYVINPGRETSLITVNDNTISAAKIQSDAVITAKILDSNVTTGKIAADAITGAKIADDAINSEHITDGSVDNIHLAGSITNAKLSNSSITINGTAVSLGGSVTAGTDWQAVTVADGSTTLAAAAGKGYFLDTNTGVIEVFLPASPTRGDTIILVDYSGTFSTNKVLINTGGKNIDSTETTSEYELTTNNVVVELVFVDNNKGWLVKENEAKSGPSLTNDGSGYTPVTYLSATGGTVSTSGDFKLHIFTGDGNFVTGSTVGNATGGGDTDYIVVAGGGAGGFDGGGGGGAGGFRMANSLGLPGPTTSPLANPSGLALSASTTYPITVGGGASDKPNTGVAGSGSNSIFSTITSAGGGGGSPGGPACRPAGAGGSGGGGDRAASSSPQKGAGNTPPVSPPQGNPGQFHPGEIGGGGGGAGGTGAADCNGNGGVGTFVSPSIGGPAGTPGPVSSTKYFSGGGAGGHNPGSVPDATQTGGSGGGGGDGVAGTANTGGGGGAGDAAGGVPQTGKAGGKGIVIIRYKFQN